MTNAMTSSPVDAYLLAQPDAVRHALDGVRAAILRAAPGAEERLSYGIPSYHYRRVGLVAFGTSKKGCSFYVRSPALMPALSRVLKGHRVTGATVHFTPAQPLPDEIVAHVVAARIAEVDGRPAT